MVILKTDEDCSVNSVGMRGGVQRIKLGGSCMSYKGIQHEMLHALGVEHEHQRPDRFEMEFNSYRKGGTLRWSVAIYQKNTVFAEQKVP